MDKIKIEEETSGRIKVIFPSYNTIYVSKIKKIDGYKWHPEGKYWSLPNTDGILDKILKTFEDKKIYLDPALKSEPFKKQSHHNFEDLRRELVSRKYGNKTVKSYIYYNRELINFTNKNYSYINDNDIKNYLFHLTEEKQAATSTLNQAINAIKFYYGTMLKKKFIYEVKRPRKDKKLPVILSREEVAKILNSVDNIKHKAILMLVYSAGLRVGEVVRLRPEDIESERMLIHIKGSKGRKDRYTLLSERVLEILKEYRERYKPVKWLFERARKGTHISTRTVQAIFENAKEKVGIRKEVSVHSLRHSFATHLLEERVLNYTRTDLQLLMPLQDATATNGTNQVRIRSFIEDCKRTGSLGQIIVGVESTGNTRYFKRVLEEAGIQVKVINTMKFKVITESVKKTNKHDAATIAEFLEKDMLPEAWICPDYSEMLRRLLQVRRQ